MYRIHQIKLGLNEDKNSIPEKIKKRLGRPEISIISWEIVKESIDARDKGDIKKVYSIDFIGEGGGIEFLGLDEPAPKTYAYVKSGNKVQVNPPIIVGFGPCGMFAGLILSEMGYNPIIIERGKSVDERALDVEKFWKEGILNEESNVQFGEGGAGTFSDGKLTTQIKDIRVRKVMEELVKAGADPEILYKQKPHIGTDVLRNVVQNIRKTIISKGGRIRFESKLTGISFGQNKELHSIIINDTEELAANQLILAIGHSARDTLRLLYENGIEMIQKPFSMGVRIEHPQEMVNCSQFGKKWEEFGLDAADYKLSYRCKNGRGVYTFCMCPGGSVIASATKKNTVVTNGMSYSKRNGENANSGLLADVRTEDFESDHPLSGIDFQEKYEKLAFEIAGGNYKAPAQRLWDFMGNKEKMSKAEKNKVGALVRPTYEPGVTFTDLTKCLPDFVSEAIREALPQLGRRLRGFDHPGAVLTGVETRSSSPVRFIRSDDFESNIKGIYPGGEGAGYAGGIVSAAVDGIKIAEKIAEQFSSENK